MELAQGKKPYSTVKNTAALLLTAVTCISSNMAFAGGKGGSGSLDPDFGIGGIAPLLDPGVVSNCYKAHGLDLQADNKIVAVTRCPSQLARYQTDGSSDSGFGTNGATGAGSVAVQVVANGQILVADALTVSFPRQAFAVQRFNSDGSLDTSFGNNGTAIAEFDPQSPIPSQYGYDVKTEALTVQADGTIVIAGSYNYYHYDGFTYPTRPVAIALARFTADGIADSSFGTGGKVITDIVSDSNPSLNPREAALGVVSTTGGTIIVAGYATGIGSGPDLTLVRYLANGDLDSTFGTGGVVTTDIGVSEQFSDLAVTGYGDITAAGWSGDGVNDDIIIVRYNTVGNLDTGFGTNGIARLDYAGKRDRANAIAIQADGKVVAAGQVTITRRIKGNDIDSSTIGVIRLNQDGSQDAGFGDNGVASTLLEAAPYASATDIVIQPDGKLTVSGESLLRYLP